MNQTEDNMTGAQEAPGYLQRLREKLSSQAFQTDLLQIFKAVLAGTLAWWISVWLLDSQMPFLAPWVALLTVHTTVSRSVSRGAQTTVASALGVGVSFLIGHFLGVSIWTFALALLIGLVGARISWIRDEGTAIATTAIFVLSSGFDDQSPLLVDRMIEVGVGVAVALAVNFLIFPPLRDKQASWLIDNLNERMGQVLCSMAEEFAESWDTEKAENWRKTIDSMNQELDGAWSQVQFARESRKVNPRRVRHPDQMGSYETILWRLDEGVTHLRNLTRTLEDSSYSDSPWDTQFREHWSDIVRAAGTAIADPDAEVESIADRLDELAETMSEEAGLPAREWPAYGSLIASMHHIIVVVDDVASSRAPRDTDKAPGSGEKKAGQDTDK